MSQQTAFADQDVAAARKALPIKARRQAARELYAESVAIGLPMTAEQVGEAFGLSVRWGRDRMTEVRNELAGPAESAETAEEEPQVDEPIAPEPVADEPVIEEQPAEPEPAETAEPEPNTGMADIKMHLRIRWGVRSTLALGVIASTIANVLHAHDNPISQTIAAWPPLALLVTIELISRVPVHTRSLAVVRFAATTIIASIAAWVSYWHMADVISRYGETGASPYLIPLTVDGLVVVASVCLVELGSRIRVLSAKAAR